MGDGGGLIGWTPLPGICVTDFERAGIPAYSRREAAAGAVAAACGL